MAGLSWSCLLSIFGLMGSALATPPSSLRLVSILYRHGDRSPEYIYPKDIHQISTWPDGLGWLSNTGKMQQFELGKYVKQRYDGFLNTTRYNHNEILVQASGVERCLMSAYSHLAGLFVPSGDQVWNPDLKWQPVPVETRPTETDNKLAEDAACPRYSKLFADLLKSDFIKEEEKRNKAFYDMVVENTGVKKETIADIWRVADTLVCEKAHNMTWNKWVYGKGVWEKMQQLRTLSFDLITYTTEMARLKGGPLLKEIIGNMKNATTKTHMPKFYMYSAHDTTVASLLRAMHVFDSHQPMYRALVMVELHEIDKNHVVKIFYRNDTTKDPYELTPPGCGKPCTLDNFVKVTKDTVPVDWYKECQLHSLSSETTVTAATWIALCVALGVCVAIIISGIILIVRLRRRNGPFYSKI